MIRPTLSVAAPASIHIPGSFRGPGKTGERHECNYRERDQHPGAPHGARPTDSFSTSRDGRERPARTRSTSLRQDRRRRRQGRLDHVQSRGRGLTQATPGLLTPGPKTEGGMSKRALFGFPVFCFRPRGAYRISDRQVIRPSGGRLPMPGRRLVRSGFNPP